VLETLKTQFDLIFKQQIVSEVLHFFILILGTKDTNTSRTKCHNYTVLNLREIAAKKMFSQKLFKIKQHRRKIAE
jgi:hypothetical protein